jgi:outer membrane protein TolC
MCFGAEEDMQLSLDVILPRARENLEIQRQRFEEGEIGAFEMIGVVAEAQFAEREALDAVQIYNDSWVELQRVIAAEP